MNYKTIIPPLLPALNILDNVNINNKEKIRTIGETSTSLSSPWKVQNALLSNMIVDAMTEIQIQKEEEDDELRLEMSILDINTSADNCNNLRFMQLQKQLQNERVQSKANVSSGMSDGGTEVRTSASSGNLADDLGSELTQGSSVSLAGGLAAALRKRRVHQSAEGEEDVTTIDLLDRALSYSPYKDRNATKTATEEKDSREGANNGKGGGGVTPFFCEGDVTALVLTGENEASAKLLAHPGYLAMTERVATAYSQQIHFHPTPGHKAQQQAMKGKRASTACLLYTSPSPRD